MRQDVHIVPVSLEVDRVVLPFLSDGSGPPQLHAHRIVLMVPSDAPSRRTAATLRRTLGAVASIEEVELESERAHRAGGFQDVLEKISRAILRELEAGNRVHLNLSSGSKVVCVAAGLAGMANLRPGLGSVYYVRPAGHSVTKQEFELHGRTKGVVEVDEVELVPVLLPEPVQLRVLGFLRDQPQRAADYREMIEFLGRIPGSDYQPNNGLAQRRVHAWNNAVTTRMVRKVLTPLQSEGLIEIKNLGRQKGAQLTTRGALYASMAAPDRSVLFKPLLP